jgi:hypothetical protein
VKLLTYKTVDMPTIAGVYYIDSSDFSTASGVWSDSGLTTLADAGYYQYDGVYRRLLVDGTLLPAFACPSCLVAPDDGGTVATTILRTGFSGRTSRIRIITSDGTGVVRVTLDPGTSRATGIYATYGSSVLSEMYSSNFGRLAGPFYGNSSHSVASEGLTTTPIDDWNGSGWDDSGEERVYSGDDFSLKGSPYGNLVMFIPKTDANDSLVLLELVSVFTSNHDWEVDIFNLIELEQLSITTVQGARAAACAASKTETVYVGRVASAIGAALADGDVLFTDATAQTPLGNGFYGFDEGANTYSVSVDQYGVISSKTICP